MKRIVYVKAVMSQRTGRAPAGHAFYSHPYSEARVRGYFGDSVTLFFERATDEPEFVVEEILEELEPVQYGTSLEVVVISRTQFLQAVRERESSNA